MGFSLGGTMTAERGGVNNSSMVVVMETPTDFKRMQSVKGDVAQVYMYAKQTSDAHYHDNKIVI